MQLSTDTYEFIKQFEDPIDNKERDVTSIRELSNFLLHITKILNCSHGFELSALCKQVEYMELKVDDASTLNTVYTQDWSLNKYLAVVESSAAVMNILFCDASMKASLELSVKALLEWLVAEIESDMQSQNTLHLATIICRFLKACETNRFDLVKCCSLKEFFNKLFYILSDFDGPTFVRRANAYQLVGKLIGCFKEVTYARHLVLSELLDKLKMLNTFLATQSKNQQMFRMHFYENYLLYLMILKDLLEYNLHQSVVNSTTTGKKKDCTIVQINKSLSNTSDKKLPFYVRCVIQDCLSLMS